MGEGAFFYPIQRDAFLFFHLYRTRFREIWIREINLQDAKSREEKALGGFILRLYKLKHGGGADSPPDMVRLPKPLIINIIIETLPAYL